MSTACAVMRYLELAKLVASLRTEGIIPVSPALAFHYCIDGIQVSVRLELSKRSVA